MLLTEDSITFLSFSQNNEFDYDYDVDGGGETTAVEGGGAVAARLYENREVKEDISPDEVDEGTLTWITSMTGVDHIDEATRFSFRMLYRSSVRNHSTIRTAFVAESKTDGTWMKPLRKHFYDPSCIVATGC